MKQMSTALLEVKLQVMVRVSTVITYNTGEVKVDESVLGWHWLNG